MVPVLVGVLIGACDPIAIRMVCPIPVLSSGTAYQATGINDPHEPTCRTNKTTGGRRGLRPPSSGGGLGPELKARRHTAHQPMPPARASPVPVKRGSMPASERSFAANQSARIDSIAPPPAFGEQMSPPPPAPRFASLCMYVIATASSP